MAASPEAFEAPTLGRAWDQLVKNIGPLLVVTVVAFIFATISKIVDIIVEVSIGSSVLSFLRASGVSGEDGSFWSSILTDLLSGASRLPFTLPFTIIATFFGVLLAAIPAVYFATGEPLTIGGAFGLLFARPWRYLIAGLLFSIVLGLGLCACLVPGLAVAFTYPIYVNKIFNTDQPILDAFSASFQALYRHNEKWSFLGIQTLFYLALVVVSFCTCGLGLIVGVPLSAFYIQNYAYRAGLVS